MNEIMNINIKKATTDPESTFASPDEVVNHIGLTLGQKISTLKKWAFVVRARVDAVSEGMTAHTEGSYTRDAELLSELEKSIEQLRESTPARQRA